MDFLKSVFERIEDNKTEMLTSLSNLISVPSVEGTAEPGKPFGKQVDRAYRMMLEMAEAEGFDVFDADGYGGHFDFDGANEGIVGIVGHLDVVPEGEGWDFEPYCGNVSDGFLLGRGTMDDKGPVVASFYAMKALKECGFRPEKTVRMILGLDEETNWAGMDYYLSKAGDLPDMGFTPDGDFPVIRAEKGILVFDIVRKLSPSKGKGLELGKIEGGSAANSVADFARAVVTDTTGGGYDIIREMVANCREEKGREITCKGAGKSLEISVRGKAAHGAKPEMGENAISILMDFLGGLNFINDEVSDFISFYNSCIGYNLHGENIGCCISDEDSGKLVFNTGMIHLDKNDARLTINIRYPVSSSAEEVYEGMMEVLDRYDIGIVKGKNQLPINLSADTPLVNTLMEVYQRHTGDLKSRPLVIGGGTYARAMENIVAFGARFPNEPELGHQKNEKISVDNLMKLTRIYAEAIYELAKAED